jgi:protein involved in polysaccharide export with SLBB domain
MVLNGDRDADRLGQAEDVILVGPIGPLVALVGSVNRPAIFELKPGETVADLLRMAGGFSAVADTSRLAIERLDERASVRVTQIDLPAANTLAMHSGDVVRALNAISVALPGQRQNKRVRIEGEVTKPGDYVLPPDSTLTDAVRLAGGLTPAAFLFGTEFTRESVRQTQQSNYDRALRDMENDMTRTTFTTRTTSVDEAAGQAASAQAATRLIERLRAVKPTGRVVLQLPPEGGQLPELALEDGDRLFVPPRPNTVGVFGSVFNTGNFLYSSGRGVTDYMRLAGGPTKGADDRSIFVVRANGSVVSSLQSSSWTNKEGDLKNMRAEPGDTIFVPEEMSKTTTVQSVRDWTQIFFQLAVGAAGLKTAIGF